MSSKDLALGAVAFALMLAIGLSARFGAVILDAVKLHPEALPAALLLAVIVGTAAGQRHFLRKQYHDVANFLAFDAAHAVSRPYVVDGDTIDAVIANGQVVRFRLANIDAPETGDNARCRHERLAGELATAEARTMVMRSAAVSVRPTFRTDRYGRRVAFVLVDGVDLGDLLVRKGLAQGWRGRRERWCGPNGGLAKMAVRRGETHNCTKCKAWR